MELLRTLILGLVVLGLETRVIKAHCLIECGNSRPREIISFGSKKIISDVPCTYKNYNSQETVTFYCADGFLERRESNVLTLICHYDQYFYAFDEPNFENPIRNIACLGNTQTQIYESRSGLPDCENYMTLVLGYKVDGLGSHKILAMCYDLDNAHLKYVGYTAYTPNTKVLHETQVGQLNNLSMDNMVDYKQNLLSLPSVTEFNNALTQERELLETFAPDTFEYASLIQDQSLSNELLDYKELLNIVWLHALRTGNWMHWLNALRDYTADSEAPEKYDVRVGISGVITLPSLDKCNTTRSLKLKIDNNGGRLIAPEYIWAHVRSLPISSFEEDQEFVIVGHNSPFTKNEDMSKLCTSMCDGIPWLRESKFGKMHNYVHFGLVQCCRVEDVAHKLQNFPLSVYKNALSSEEDHFESDLPNFFYKAQK